MVDKKDCCGCTACVHICPVKCITMREDEEGFLYPEINKEKCINCHKCEKVCPIQNIKNENTKTETFVGYNKNEEIRRISSSGGVFSAVAQWILEQNGVVFGVAFDKNFEVCHIAVQMPEELSKLRGSKYVQSRLENSYPLVKHYLENKRKVLFTGTACQIAGLQNYLNKAYENLYTIDVLCHGAPSPKIFRMYLDDKRNIYNSSIESIEFRNKKNGWKNYCVKIEFSNNQTYFENYYEDKYMKMFLQNIDLRLSCYACQFKGFPRISDMTIGDSWGIEYHLPEMDDDGGTSVILIHSEKGKQMIEAFKSSFNLKETSLDKALPVTEGGRSSAQMHPNRKKFFDGLKRGEDFDNLYGYLQKNLAQKVISFIRYILVRLKLRNK